MKSKKKTIVTVAIIVFVALIISLLAKFAYAVVLIKTSGLYKDFCEEASFYDEFGHVKDFDPSVVDISWYEDVRMMSDEEFFNWWYDVYLYKYTELTKEQYIINKFRSPLRPVDKYFECETEWDEYELSLKYSTSADLKAYNEKHSTNFNSIEEVVYADIGENRTIWVKAVIREDDAIKTFADEHGISFYDVVVWECVDDVLANYYEYEVTDEEVDIVIEDYLQYTDSFYDKIIFQYFFNHDWKNAFVHRALHDWKVDARFCDDFS